MLFRSSPLIFIPMLLSASASAGIVEKEDGGEDLIDLESDHYRKNIEPVLDNVMTKINAEANEDNLLILIKVLNATEQVVQGSLYRFNLLVGKSFCSKVKSPDTCDASVATDHQKYFVTVWNQPWLGPDEITIKKQDD